MLIARAKENLWKRFREKEETEEMEEDELKAWEDIQNTVLELEEEGSWKNECIKVREIKIRQEKLKVKEDTNKEKTDKKESSRRKEDREKSELEIMRERIMNKREQEQEPSPPSLTELEITRRRILEKAEIPKGKEEGTKMGEGKPGVVMAQKRKLECQASSEGEHAGGFKEIMDWKVKVSPMVSHLSPRSEGRAGGHDEVVAEAGHSGRDSDIRELKPREKMQHNRIFIQFIQEITTNNEGDSFVKELEREEDTGEGRTRMFMFRGHDHDQALGSPSKRLRVTGSKPSTPSAGNIARPACPPPTTRGGQPTCPPRHRPSVGGLKTAEAASITRRGREDGCWGENDGQGTIHSRWTGSEGSQWRWGAGQGSSSSSSSKLLLNTTHSSKNIQPKNLIDIVHLPPVQSPALRECSTSSPAGVCTIVFCKGNKCKI